MITQRQKLVFWILLGLIQLTVPTWIILRQEHILSLGNDFRLRLAPLDPADPFRGRFMNLAFDAENKDYPRPRLLESGSRVPLYARLEVADDGYAYIAELSVDAPNAPYLEIPAGNWRDSWNSKDTIRLNLPFRRFYVNETKAAAMEEKSAKLMREARQQHQPSPLFCVVRVHQGQGVLTDLRGPEGSLR